MKSVLKNLKVIGATGLTLLATGGRAAKPPTELESKVVDQTLISKKTPACENFFEYACGEWLRKTPIPSDRSKFYRFSEIDINTENLLKDILEKYRQGQFQPPQKFAQQLGSFYKSCLDPKKTNRAGKEGLEKLLSSIEKIEAHGDSESSKSLARLVAEFHQQGIPVFFSFFVDQDPGDARNVIPQMDQGGLGLPERGYYLDDNKEMKTNRQKYLQHLEKMFKMASIKSSPKKESKVALSQQVFSLEEALAKVSLSPIERRDPKALYHPMVLSELQKLSPHFNWEVYWETLGLPANARVNVSVPLFFQGLSEQLQKHSLDQLKVYLRWHVLHAVAEFATESLMAEDFNFYKNYLNGQKSPRPRWKTCVSSVDEFLGEALGEAFIQVAFGADAKKFSANMMNQVQEVVRDMFQQLDWMDKETRAGAVKKLNTLMKKVGYPDTARDYEAYKVRDDSWFENNLEGQRFEFRRRLSKIGKPVDRSEWGMTAPTNNAYYNPLLNEIVFPAGILQEPLFNLRADLASNYGATGATIGHEITHGFDDEGRQFDENGNLKNWWTDFSTKRFNEKAQCLVKQYDSYKVAGGISLKGALTLGENIADLGGLKIALRAFERASEKKPSNEEYQKFFVAYAQSWCGKSTPSYEKNIVQVDPHSPARFRVNGVVVNLPEFARAFQCKEGQAMAPQSRCEVW